MNFRETTVKKNIVHKGAILTMREDDAKTADGRDCTRVVVEHPGGVCVAALTENDELIFVRQFRYPYMETILELPAGKLNDGEDMLLLTSLASDQAIRTANIVGAMCVVVHNAKPLPQTMCQVADTLGIPLISSPLSKYDSCIRIHAFLEGEKR